MAFKLHRGKQIPPLVLRLNCLFLIELISQSFVPFVVVCNSQLSSKFRLVVTHFDGAKTARMFVRFSVQIVAALLEILKLYKRVQTLPF